MGIIYLFRCLVTAYKNGEYKEVILVIAVASIVAVHAIYWFLSVSYDMCSWLGGNDLTLTWIRYLLAFVFLFSFVYVLVKTENLGKKEDKGTGI